MKIDLHGYELWEAIEEIILILEECKIKGESQLELIHGYRQGQVLRNYFRSEKFLDKMAREGYKIARKPSKNPGISIFELS